MCARHGGGDQFLAPDAAAAAGPTDESDDAVADDTVRDPGPAPLSDVLLTARSASTRIGALFQAVVPQLRSKPPPPPTAGVGGTLVWAPVLNPSDESRIIDATMAAVWGPFNRCRCLRRRATPLAAPNPSRGGALCRAYRVDNPGALAAGALDTTETESDAVYVVFEESSQPTRVAWADVRMARCVRRRDPHDTLCGGRDDETPAAAAGRGERSCFYSKQF